MKKIAVGQNHESATSLTSFSNAKGDDFAKKACDCRRDSSRKFLDGLVGSHSLNFLSIWIEEQVLPERNTNIEEILQEKNLSVKKKIFFIEKIL
jgi:hypothetical protein